MPRIELTVKDTEPSVTRPVAFAVIRDVLKTTNLTPNPSILFPGGEVAYQPSTTLSSKNEGREKHLLSHDKRVFLELDEDYDEDSAITGAIMKPENIFVFADPELDCYIKPAYSTILATLTVRYRARDRVEALRWRDGVRARVQMGRRELLHSVSYSYLVPSAAITMLKEIHSLRENVMGYGDSFEKYKDEHFTNRKTIVTTLSGSQPVDAVTEHSKRIIGSFEFGLRPERAERDGNADAWVIGFTYKYTYLRPIAVVMHYPLTVHNQLLSEKYRINEKSDRDDFHTLSHSFSTGAFKYFEPDRVLDLWKSQRGVYLPEFDDFVPASVLLNSIRVFTGLVLIDMDDPELLMNFGELGDWTMEDDIKAFLASEAPYTRRQYKSIFDISFYRNRDLMDEKVDMIELRENLDVVLMKPVSLRNYFHIRLGICSDLSLLDPDALLRLRANSCIFKKIINAINPSFDVDQYLSKLNVCGPVSESEMSDIVNGLRKGGNILPISGVGNNPNIPYINSNDPSKRYGFNTVQGFFIKSRKEELV